MNVVMRPPKRKHRKKIGSSFVLRNFMKASNPKRRAYQAGNTYFMACAFPVIVACFQRQLGCFRLRSLLLKPLIYLSCYQPLLILSGHFLESQAARRPVERCGLPGVVSKIKISKIVSLREVSAWWNLCNGDRPDMSHPIRCIPSLSRG